MKIYIASRDRGTLSLWESVIGTHGTLQYTTAVPPGLDVDAVVMSGMFAFDRYGGRPNRHEAQIIGNSRDDGFPRYVVIPPYRPLEKGADGTYRVPPRFAEITPSYYAVSCTLRDVELWNEMSRGTPEEIKSMVLDLALLEMDNPHDESTPKSVAKAILEHLSRRGD